MVCSCCSAVPTVTIQLLFTAAGLLYGQQALIPKSYKWTKRIIFTITSLFALALSGLGIALLVLNNNNDLRSKTFANFCISKSTEATPLDEFRCSILERGDASGKVMEFGSGPGSNFKCFQKKDNNSTISEYVAVEPNSYFHTALLQEKERYDLNFPLEIVGLKGEDIDIPKDDYGSFDAVISTHVLCSVDSPDLVLQNADRLLKPGGRYIFFEHVLVDYNASPKLWYIQQITKPFLYIIGNGCKIINVEDVLKYYFYNDTKFHLDITHFDGPMPFFLAAARPHIMGIVTKRR